MDKHVFEETFTEISSGAINLFHEHFKNSTKDALNDIRSFIEESKTKLEKWVAELTKGEIDESLFKQFVTSRQALLQMKLLTHKGMTQIKVDRFQNGLKDLIVNKLLEKFLPG
jgi:hypothetical protein